MKENAHFFISRFPFPFLRSWFYQFPSHCVDMAIDYGNWTSDVISVHSSILRILVVLTTQFPQNAHNNAQVSTLLQNVHKLMKVES